jgi:hypothetical protein
MFTFIPTRSPIWSTRLASCSKPQRDASDGFITTWFGYDWSKVSDTFARQRKLSFLLNLAHSSLARHFSASFGTVLCCIVFCSVLFCFDRHVVLDSCTHAILWYIRLWDCLTTVVLDTNTFATSIVIILQNVPKCIVEVLHSSIIFWCNVLDCNAFKNRVWTFL